MLGCLCMSGSMTTTKLAAKMAPIVQVRFIRSAITLVVAYIYATSFKDISITTVNNKAGLAMRIGMTVFQTFSQMYIARKLPLGLSAALMGLSPVTSTVLQSLILGVSVSMSQWACILTTVGGVFMISQPAIIMEKLYGESNDYEEFDTEKYIAIGLAISMSVCRSLTMIMNRKLAMQGNGRSHFSQMTFYNSLAAMILCVLLLPFKGNVGYKLLEIPPWEAVALTAVGAVLFFGRPILMEFGGARLPQTLNVILRSTNIIWAFVFQLLLFGEVPNSMEATGILTIVTCALMMFKITGND